MAETIIALSLFCLGIIFLFEESHYLNNLEVQKSVLLKKSQQTVNISYKLLDQSAKKLSSKEQQLLNEAVK